MLGKNFVLQLLRCHLLCCLHPEKSDKRHNPREIDKCSAIVYLVL